MVQELDQTVNEIKCGGGAPYNLNISPLAGVDINDAAARLQSRGNASDDNIFEILPRFCITPEKDQQQQWKSLIPEKGQQVRVHAAAGGIDVTGIAVDNELVIFERDRDAPAKHLRFSASIDFIVWRRSILLIGLSSSELVLIDPNIYSVKHKWKICQDVENKTRFFVDAFIHSNPDPTKMDVVVVSVCGLVYRYPDISLSVGSLDATHDQNVSLDVDLGTVKESWLKLHITSDIMCATSPTRNKLIVVEKSGRVLNVDFDDELCEDDEITSAVANLCLYFNMSNGVSPIKVISFDGVMYVLLSNGTIESFIDKNLFNGQLLKLSEEPVMVHDFTIIINNEGALKLWVLYSVISATVCENYVGIFSGCNFTTEFIFKLPILQSLNHFQLTFPRHVSRFEEPFSIIEVSNSNIRLYHMLETSTDATLQKLLARGKYKDAEQLAIKYNKDLDIVRKAEARDKMNAIISLSSVEGEPFESSLKDILRILGAIRDAEFVCDFCVQAPLQKVEGVRQLLALGKGRVQECRGTAAANSLLLHIKQFYTFELVYPAGSISDWNSLISPDNTMFLQSVKFLENGNFDKCEKIWRRHSDEFIPDIGLIDFLPFFNNLFDHQLKTEQSVSLLKTVLPFAVQKVALSVSVDSNTEHKRLEMPELNVLIGIILRQVGSLESKIDWPMNALSFVQILSGVIQDEVRRYENPRMPLDSATTKERLIVQRIRAKLDGLNQILEELADLKKHHSIRVLFKDYNENEIPEVINNMLYNLLRTDEIERFVSKFLRPFAERKKFSIDFLFSEHIKSVLQDIPYFIQAINIPHEERIICLVNLIGDLKVKLKCTLRIAEEWPVPWTAGIDSMVKQILDMYPRNSLDSECALIRESISIMRMQVPYRCVLNKYKLTGSKMLRKSCYVRMALLRILNMKKEGFYEDCKELLKNVPGSLISDDILEYLEFTRQIYQTDISDEDTIPKNRANARRRKLLLELELSRFDSSNHLAHMYSTEEHERFINIYGLLALECNDQRTCIIAKLKVMFPSMPLGIIYQTEFPYSALTYLLEDSPSMNAKEIIGKCKRLAKITGVYYADILVTVGSCFTRAGMAGDRGTILWSIIEEIVNSPLNIDINNTIVNQDLLQISSYEILMWLMCQCPTLSMEQMNVVQEFLCRIGCSFVKLCMEISQQLAFFRIFSNLKEQEIPLENKFLEVYMWSFGQGKGWETIKITLENIGKTLLKFGETDIYSSIFISIKRAILDASSRADEGAHMKYFAKIAADIDLIKESLLNQSIDWKMEEDADRNLTILVEDLNNAGIKVNTYALKVRNKIKLLDRLLQMRNYVLAAQLAITFEIYEDHKCWSSILQGFIGSGNLDELRSVLERIRTITGLWILPEFAESWKKVSEVDSCFYDMCPIPLD